MKHRYQEAILPPPKFEMAIEGDWKNDSHP